MNLDNITLRPEATIRDALLALDGSGAGALIVAGAEGRLRAIITDGDIRRALLRRFSLDDSLASMLEQEGPREPIALPIGATRAQVRAVFKAAGIQHLPLVDHRGQVVRLLLWRDLAEERFSELNAVIMAGGMGTRLRPLTDTTPKPMLHVGSRPIIEHIVRHLVDHGITDIAISVNYLGDQIIDHFGDGKAFGASIEYLHEEGPLGTAGALHGYAKRDRPVFVINGDILTQVDVSLMYRFHHNLNADITIGLSSYQYQIPFGVVETADMMVTRIIEKPKRRTYVNGGIYILESHLIDLIPRGRSFNMTDLIDLVIDEGKAVAGFPIREYWRDIGRPQDLAAAAEDVARWERP